MITKKMEMESAHSCLSRAREDEPVFVLLARDVVAPDVIEYWAQQRIEAGKNKPDDPQIKEAFEMADAMRRYRSLLAQQQRSG